MALCKTWISLDSKWFWRGGGNGGDGGSAFGYGAWWIYKGKGINGRFGCDVPFSLMVKMGLVEGINWIESSGEGGEGGYG